MLTLRLSTQAQNDVARITRQLADMQAQVASGSAHYDLKGFAGASSRLLNARTQIAASDSKASVLNQMQARFGVQGAALGQISDAAQLLAQSIREAVSANDGRGIATELELSFATLVSSLNETWNGQPMFAGERQTGVPIKITSLAGLVAATGPQDIFDEATRHQVIDLGGGAPTVMAAKASELSTDLFNTLKSLKLMLDSTGGTLGSPISGTQQDQLNAFAAQLDSQAALFVNEEGRAGQLQKRFEGEIQRLQFRSDLLTKEIGEQADADLAEVSVRLSALLTQYEAAAKTFAELSRVSLLDYL